jgi:hypothetical protein
MISSHWQIRVVYFLPISKAEAKLRAIAEVEDDLLLQSETLSENMNSITTPPMQPENSFEESYDQQSADIAFPRWSSW